MEDKCQVIAAETKDFKEGVQAFLEKEKQTLKENKMIKVSIIGAGTMGTGIAQIAATKAIRFVYMMLLMVLLKIHKTNLTKFLTA